MGDRGGRGEVHENEKGICALRGMQLEVLGVEPVSGPGAFTLGRSVKVIQISG